MVKIKTKNKKFSATVNHKIITRTHNDLGFLACLKENNCVLRCDNKHCKHNDLSGYCSSPSMVKIDITGSCDLYVKHLNSTKGIQNGC